jgi:ABC-2 type transport system permease protein
MKKVLVIANREFKSFLSSPGYYVLAGIFLLIISFMYITMFQHFVNSTQKGNFNPFMQQEMNLHNAVFSGHVHWVNLLFLFVIPVLMGRVLADEKRMRSFDLLMTSPLTSTQIILGKFLGSLFAIWLMVAVSMIYPISASLFTEMQWGKLFSAYLGVFMITGIYAAAGLFCSAVTESVVLASVGGIILNIAFLIVGAFAVHADKEWVTTVVEHISLGQHIELFNRGLVESGSVIFCLSVILLFSFLSERVVESARWRS